MSPFLLATAFAGADLKIKCVPGDAFESLMEIKLTVSTGGSYRQQATMKEKLTKIKGKEYFWEVEFVAEAPDAEGELKNMPEALSDLKLTQVRDEREKLLYQVYEGMRMNQSPGAGQSSLLYPTQPIAPGFAWVVPLSSMGQNAKLEYSYRGTAKLEGRVVHLVAGAMLKHPTIKTVRPMDFVIDATTGKVIRASHSITLTVPQGVMTTSYRITCLKGPKGLASKRPEKLL